MKVLITVDDSNGMYTTGEPPMYIGVLPAGLAIKEYEPEEAVSGAEAAIQLASLDYTAADLIKLKVAGVL